LGDRSVGGSRAADDGADFNSSCLNVKGEEDAVIRHSPAVAVTAALQLDYIPGEWAIVMAATAVAIFSRSLAGNFPADFSACFCDANGPVH
jgi:hypothetical protein